MMIGLRINYPINHSIKIIQYYLLLNLQQMMAVPILAQIEILYYCLSLHYNEIFFHLVLSPIIHYLNMIPFIKVYLILL